MLVHILKKSFTKFPCFRSLKMFNKQINLQKERIYFNKAGIKKASLYIKKKK